MKPLRKYLKLCLTAISTKVPILTELLILTMGLTTFPQKTFKVILFNIQPLERVIHKVHSSTKYSFPNKNLGILSCEIDVSFPSITAARLKINHVTHFPEIVNPFIFPKSWELSRNGLVITARNLAGLVFFAFEE